jgi:hypothetical protein
MPDATAALTAIKAANEARGEAWTALSIAEARLSHCGDHGRGGARLALDDALDACDRMRASIVTAQAETGKLGERATGEAPDGG